MLNAITKLRNIWNNLMNRGNEKLDSERWRKVNTTTNLVYVLYLTLMGIVILTSIALGVALLKIDRTKYLSYLLPYALASMLPTLGIFFTFYFREYAGDPLGRTKNITLPMLTHFFGMVHLTSYSIFLGSEAGYHFFFLTTIPLPFFIVLSRDAKSLIISMLVSALSFGLVLYWHANLQPLYPLPDFMDAFVFKMIIAGTIFALLAGVSILWTQSNQTEEILESQKHQLMLQASALDHINADLMQQLAALTLAENAGRESTLPIRTGRKHRILKCSEIIYLSSGDRKTMIHTLDESYEVAEAFKDIEGSLPNDMFLKVHKQFIVNIKFVGGIEHLGAGRYQIILTDDDQTPVSLSREIVAKLRKKLGFDMGKEA